MVIERAPIESLEAGRVALVSAGVDGVQRDLVVVVEATVPAWLGDLVAAAALAGSSVDVEARSPAQLSGEVLDGWQIGVCTAALAAGATSIVGVAPARVARVRAISDALSAHTQTCALPSTEPSA